MSELYRLALAGQTPAEALPRPQRWLLVAELWNRGWSIQRIAEHIRETPYTTLRIRDLPAREVA